LSLPERVTVYEVGPRDGLQNVADPVPSHVKVAFIEALAAAGLPAIEATSFVSPKAVPQLADAALVFPEARKREGTRYPALVPNLRGYEAALAAGAREVAVFTAASEAFNRANVNATVDESLARFAPVCERARQDGVALRGYVSTAFGCPYQGDVSVDAVVRVTGRLFDQGCGEVSVGDTIGVADPAQVHEVVGALAARFPVGAVALHLHDTWGRGLANVVAGLEAGVTTFDSSAGGLGGCPYAPGATGNLATEDLVSLLDRLGIETGVDVEAVADASVALGRATRLPQPSRALAALVAHRARPG
jgi:hydroxymethylglutaryl-CoA lyase